MYCLDTDIIVSFMRGDEQAVDTVNRMAGSGTPVAVTMVSLCELYKGAFLSVKQEESIEFVNAFLERVTLLPQDKRSCLLFGQDYAFLMRKGRLTSEMDLMIASICKAHRAILVTRNLGDFRDIPHLSVEKW